MLPCITKHYLGFDCMGCGLQRSALLLCKGQFMEAFTMYPGIYPLIFLFGFLGISYVFQIRNSSMITSFLAISTALTIIVSYIIKLTTIF
ncbi:DUF2752 domain-containing protein [Flavimarina sp. Hel_I_48]|uniref:DUF2752 domain-containing protein n=1 Tax=Flavimarina sp. Hel_I_48 TaxID=1392488 RepID=UPI0021D1DDFF|nr:DUF2752 domain-containing protein [Flavimarina sp. Hel_I_48]